MYSVDSVMTQTIKKSIPSYKADLDFEDYCARKKYPFAGILCVIYVSEAIYDRWDGKLPYLNSQIHTALDKVNLLT